MFPSTIFVSVFLSACLFITGYSYAIYDLNKAQKFSLIHWSIMSISTVYGAVWLFIIIGVENGLDNRFSYWIASSSNFYYIHTVYSFILLISIIVGWKYSIRLNQLLNLKFANYKFNFKSLTISHYIFTAWVSLALAFFLLFIYSYAYGGLIDLIENAKAIRQGKDVVIDHVVISNPLKFIKPFISVIYFSSFLFFSILIVNKKLKLVWLGFFLSFLFSIYWHMTRLGRLEFLIYLSIFPLTIYFIRFDKVRQQIICIGLFFILLMFLSYFVSIFIFSDQINLIQYIFDEACFPFVSFFAQMSDSENWTRYFIDFIYMPLYFFPSSLWSVWGVTEISQLNTELIVGMKKGINGNTTGMPVDLLTLGLMQASVIGIMITGVLYGVLIRFLQYCIDEIKLNSVRITFQIYIALKFSFVAIFYSQPVVLVKSNVDLLLICSILLITKICISRTDYLRV